MAVRSGPLSLSFTFDDPVVSPNHLRDPLNDPLVPMNLAQRLTSGLFDHNHWEWIKAQRKVSEYTRSRKKHSAWLERVINGAFCELASSEH